MSDIFSPDALRARAQKELDAAEALPDGDVRVGVVARKDAQGADVGIVGRGKVDIGKPGGWFVAGEGAWWKRAGASAAALIGWKKRGA